MIPTAPIPARNVRIGVTELPMELPQAFETTARDRRLIITKPDRAEAQLGDRATADRAGQNPRFELAVQHYARQDIEEVVLVERVDLCAAGQDRNTLRRAADNDRRRQHGVWCPGYARPSERDASSSSLQVERIVGSGPNAAETFARVRGSRWRCRCGTAPRRRPRHESLRGLRRL